MNKYSYQNNQEDDVGNEHKQVPGSDRRPVMNRLPQDGLAVALIITGIVFGVIVELLVRVQVNQVVQQRVIRLIGAGILSHVQVEDSSQQLFANLIR